MLRALRALCRLLVQGTAGVDKGGGAMCLRNVEVEVGTPDLPSCASRMLVSMLSAVQH